MIESLKVGAILNLEGNFLEKFKLISESFRKFDLTLNSTQSKLNEFSLSIDKFSSFNPFREMNASLVELKSNLASTVKEMEGLRVMSAGGSGRGGGRHGMHGYLRESLGIAGMRIGGGLSWPAMAIGGAAYIGYQGESDWQRNLMRIQSQGFSQSQVQDAANFANNSNIRGIDPTSLLKAVRDSAMATKSMPMALKLAPSLATVEYENKIQFHKQYSATQAASLIKFAEIRSGGDLTKMLDTVNLVEKMMNVSGGNLMPLQMFTNVTAGSLAMQHISDKGMFALEPIIQELNRAGLGTALQSGAFELLGGHANKAAAASMVREGIGHMVGKRFTLNNDWADLYMTNPVQFAFNYHDMLKNKFHMSDKQISAQEEMDFVRTTAKFVGLANKNRAKINRTVGLYDSVPGVEGTADNVSKTLPGNMQNLANAYKGLSKAWGDLVDPSEIAGINALTVAIRDFAGVIKLISAGKNIYEGLTSKNINFGEIWNGVSQAGDLVNSYLSTPSTETSASIDPHQVYHIVSTMMGRDAEKPLSGTSGVNSFQGRLLTQLNSGF